MTPNLEQQLNSLVARVIREPATINTKDESGNTALHLASKHGDEKVVQTLLSYGPDVNALDSNSRTPLHNAGSAPVAKLLLACGARINARDNSDSTPLYRAMLIGEGEVQAELIKHGADVNASNKAGLTALHQCIAKEIAYILLGAGANVDARDKSLRTPLHAAMIKDHLDMVSILLEHGADANATNRDREAPLHIAYNPRAVKLLLAYGAIVNARDANSSNPLHMAVKNQWWRYTDLRETTKLLLDAGVDTHAKDKDGHTAIQSAVRYGLENAVLVLLEHKVEFFPQTHHDIEITLQEIIRDNCHNIGRLLDASLKLKLAGLRPTEENLRALAHNPHRNCFELNGQKLHYKDGTVEEFKLECQREVETWKGHEAAKYMSLEYIIHTDSVHYLADRQAFETMQKLDYTMYPIYESFMVHKFARDKLIVYAKEHFSRLLRYSKMKTSSLPDELVSQILVQLNSADIKKLISCSVSIEAKGAYRSQMYDSPSPSSWGVRCTATKYSKIPKPLRADSPN